MTLNCFDRPIKNRPLEETNLLCLAKFEHERNQAIGLLLYACCCTAVLLYVAHNKQQQYTTYGYVTRA